MRDAKGRERLRKYSAATSMTTFIDCASRHADFKKIFFFQWCFSWCWSRAELSLIFRKGHISTAPFSWYCFSPQKEQRLQICFPRRTNECVHARARPSITSTNFGGLTLCTNSCIPKSWTYRDALQCACARRVLRARNAMHHGRSARSGTSSVLRVGPQVKAKVMAKVSFFGTQVERYDNGSRRRLCVWNTGGKK